MKANNQIMKVLSITAPLNAVDNSCNASLLSDELKKYKLNWAMVLGFNVYFHDPWPVILKRFYSCNDRITKSVDAKYIYTDVMKNIECLDKYPDIKQEVIDIFDSTH